MMTRPRNDGCGLGARARQKAEQEAQNRDRRAAPRAARLLHHQRSFPNCFCGGRVRKLDFVASCFVWLAVLRGKQNATVCATVCTCHGGGSESFSTEHGELRVTFWDPSRRPGWLLDGPDGQGACVMSKFANRVLNGLKTPGSFFHASSL